MKLWKLCLVRAGKRFHEPPLVIAESAEEALLVVRVPVAGEWYEAEACEEVSEYERAILAEQAQAEKIQDAQIRAFYEDNVRGLRRTLERLRK